MRALHSSAALVINLFDYWTDRDCTLLQESLGLGDEIIGIEFERQYPTGLGGTPPNIDVVLTLRDGTIVGIESKFSEWMVPNYLSKPAFAPSYFPKEMDLWESIGLPTSQELASAVDDGRAVFQYLDAPQMLKHALGITRECRSVSSLWYVFFDWPGKAGKQHRAEITRFGNAVGPELNFRALSYQELFESLSSQAGHPHEAYLGYLRSRYFHDPLLGQGGASVSSLRCTHG